MFFSVAEGIGIEEGDGSFAGSPQCLPVGFAFHLHLVIFFGTGENEGYRFFVIEPFYEFGDFGFEFFFGGKGDSKIEVDPGLVKGGGGEDTSISPRYFDSCANDRRVDRASHLMYSDKRRDGASI
jgi:hypothetical protein